MLSAYDASRDILLFTLSIKIQPSYFVILLGWPFIYNNTKIEIKKEVSEPGINREEKKSI